MSERAVLISIQPKWVDKIASGEKTIEVRKTKPNLQTKFKCYIYETQAIYKTRLLGLNCRCQGRGKVIGEFVCDRIDEFHDWELSPSKRFYEEEKARLDLFLKESCLTYEEVCEYRKNLPSIKPLYAWHISDLKIYDKPKELSDFWTIKCNNKRNGCQGCEIKPNCIKTITRPPQSYMSVEPLKEN